MNCWNAWVRTGHDTLQGGGFQFRGWVTSSGGGCEFKTWNHNVVPGFIHGGIEGWVLIHVLSRSRLTPLCQILGFYTECPRLNQKFSLWVRAQLTIAWPLYTTISGLKFRDCFFFKVPLGMIGEVSIHICVSFPDMGFQTQTWSGFPYLMVKVWCLKHIKLVFGFLREFPLLWRQETPRKLQTSAGCVLSMAAPKCCATPPQKTADAENAAVRQLYTSRLGMFMQFLQFPRPCSSTQYCTNQETVDLQFSCLA